MAAENRMQHGCRSRGVARASGGVELHPDDEARLYYAIDFDDPVLLKMLLQTGGLSPSAKFPGHLSKSALQVCCEKGHVECAMVLVNAGANMEAQDDWFHTPLVSSVSTGRGDMVKMLVSAGCNTESKDKLGMTAVHYAVNDCETGCLSELIKASADVNAMDYNGRTPAWLAAEKDGRIDYLEMLVRAKCNVNLKDRREKRTPLQIAIMKSSADMVDYVRVLLEAGANTNTVDLLGMSPMSCLIRRVTGHHQIHSEIHDIERPHLEVARLLIDAGYDVNFTSTAHYPFQFHGTSLKMAVERGAVQIVQLLLQRGADPDASDDKNATPLHVAACRNFQHAGRLLIRANCALDRIAAELTVSGATHTKLTPFACAVLAGHADFAELLLSAGYDVRQDAASMKELMTSSQEKTAQRMTSFEGVTSAQRVTRIEELMDTVNYWCKNPRPLSCLCRCLARSLLGKNIERKVRELPVPIGVKNNLLLANVVG